MLAAPTRLKKCYGLSMTQQSGQTDWKKNEIR
jgi:hypothetical protein